MQLTRVTMWSQPAMKHSERGDCRNFILLGRQIDFGNADNICITVIGEPMLCFLLSLFSNGKF